jgi:hypothetical protein
VLVTQTVAFDELRELIEADPGPTTSGASCALVRAFDQTDHEFQLPASRRSRRRFREARVVARASRPGGHAESGS